MSSQYTTQHGWSSMSLGRVPLSDEFDDSDDSEDGDEGLSELNLEDIAYDRFGDPEDFGDSWEDEDFLNEEEDLDPGFDEEVAPWY